MRRGRISVPPSIRLPRIVEVSDEVTEGSFRTSTSSSPSSLSRRSDSTEEEDKRSTSSSRVGVVSSSSNHHHSEHGIAGMRHDHHPQRKSEDRTGSRQSLSSSAAVRMIQHVESTVLRMAQEGTKFGSRVHLRMGTGSFLKRRRLSPARASRAAAKLFQEVTVSIFGRLPRFCSVWLVLLECITSTVYGRLQLRGFPADVDIPEPATSKLNEFDTEAMSTLKYEMAHLKQTVENHESRLTSHETQFKLLRTEISQVISATAASLISSTRVETVEQIIERVLAIPVGETGEGAEVTVGSMFGALREEIRGADLGDKLEMVEQQFQAFSNELVSLKDGMNELEASVELLGQNGKAEMEKFVVPLLITEIGKQIALKNSGDGVPFSGLSIKDVHWMIKRAISKYDADKTGLPDLALESAGGSILSVRNTPAPKLRGSVVKSFWGFRLWSPPNTPRTIIQPGVVPGECWAFEGSVGNVVVKLAVPSRITGFTMEHIPKSVSRYGHIDSAPRLFQVFGLLNEHDNQPDQVHDYGTFAYEDKDEPLQYFSVLNKTFMLYPIVELKILSNHGNPKHTCVYRFRVHGELNS
ncbi:SUN domain-containing protein 1 [Orchesella cincta]|uniref:SUN domain-containing protein 1 n=1 Tax=Orchesella cincta TaxID=48709 RepID=A0A1D2MFR8_ORCCI|nr:SUN domain-containing protein 1 [Orchesella cincta]